LKPKPSPGWKIKLNPAHHLFGGLQKNPSYSRGQGKIFPQLIGIKLVNQPLRSRKKKKKKKVRKKGGKKKKQGGREGKKKKRKRKREKKKNKEEREKTKGGRGEN